MKFSFTVLLVAIAALLLVSACRKSFPKTDSDLFDASAAKEWYYGNFKKSTLYSSYNSHVSGKKLPDWKNGVYKKMGSSDVVEFPLVKQSSIVLVAKKDGLTESDKKRIAEATISRIVFIKTATGSIIVREFMYIPDMDYLQTHSFDISRNSIGNLDKDFSGVIVVQKWNGSIISRSTLEDGKIVKRTTLQVSGGQTTSRVTTCSGTLVTEYERDCDVEI